MQRVHSHAISSGAKRHLPYAVPERPRGCGSNNDKEGEAIKITASLDKEGESITAAVGQQFPRLEVL
jgi:hypothetical protein